MRHALELTPAIDDDINQEEESRCSWASRDERRIPRIHVLSGHPLVRFAVMHLLRDELYEIAPVTSSTCSSLRAHDGILLVDSSSVGDWAQLIYRWRTRGGRSLLIVPERPKVKDEIRLIHLGSAGVIPFVTIDEELARAVTSVLEDHLWASPAALEALVKRAAHCAPASDDWFTQREGQILTFLMQGASNKTIGTVLHISERTVKFHVTNLLRKLSVQNRRALKRSH